MAERVRASKIAQWVAVAVVVLVMLFGILVATGLITDDDADRGSEIVATIVSDTNTVIPLVETAIAPVD